MKAPTPAPRSVSTDVYGWSSTVPPFAGLVACRELDDALGLTEMASECLQETRGGRNVQHRLVGLLRQSVYSRLAGYEDTNDAERLAKDPTMRIIVGRRDTDIPAASTNTMSRFETEVLTQDGNVEGLDRLNAKWVDGAMSRTPHRRVILDMDSSESSVHGEQEGASYNGHFGSTCYHPLFVFNQFGDCEGAMLRAGNVHSAHRWRDVLDPILSRYGSTGVRRYFRADAAFAKPDIYEYLEERRVFYAIRLPSNKVLQYEIAPLLIRPVGRPPKRPVILYDDFWLRRNKTPAYLVVGIGLPSRSVTCNRHENQPRVDHHSLPCFRIHRRLRRRDAGPTMTLADLKSRTTSTSNRLAENDGSEDQKE